MTINYAGRNDGNRNKEKISGNQTERNNPKSKAESSQKDCEGVNNQVLRVLGNKLINFCGKVGDVVINLATDNFKEKDNEISKEQKPREYEAACKIEADKIKQKKDSETLASKIEKEELENSEMCFNDELIKVSHLLEPTYLTVFNKNDKRAEIFSREWQESFTSISSKVLRKQYKSLNCASSLMTLDAWLILLKKHGLIRYNEEWFDFTSEYDCKLFANGAGYTVGSRVKLLQSFWYMEQENSEKVIISKGVIDTTCNEEAYSSLREENKLENAAQTIERREASSNCELEENK